MVDAPAEDPATVNQAAWSVAAEEFALEGFSDEGELAAMLAVAPAVRGGRILDLGVGAGRTIALLLLISDDYVAVDYTAEMVELARSRHPGVDIRHGDARALTDVPDGSVDLVNFSLNGIDAVDHDDRQRVLAEIARVLRPDGRLLFSTLNIDGSLFGCDPSNAPTMPWLPGSLVPLTEGPPLPPDEGRIGRAIRSWRRLRKLTVTGDGWAVAPMPAHEFALLTHFTTLERQRAELAEHGLEPLLVFDADSRVPLADGAGSTAPYVQIVAGRAG